MLRAPQVIPQSPPPPVFKLALSEQGDVFLLDDDSVIGVYNISFDEFQKRISQAQRKHFPDDNASTVFIRERVIMLDTRKHPNAYVEANLDYTGATRLNF